jgi:hypothetical protein
MFFYSVVLLPDAYCIGEVQLTDPNSMASISPCFCLALGFDIVDDLL